MEQKSFLEQIDVISLIRDIVRSLWMILISTLAVVLLTYVVVSLRYQPRYTTRTIFVVTSKSDSGDVYSNLKSARETAARFTEVLGGTLLRKAVAEDLGMESFRADMQSAPTGTTNMVELSVTADSAVESFRIMKSVLKNYPKVTDYIIGNVNLEIIDPPTLPTAPINKKNTARAMQQAALVTFALLCLLEAALSLSRNTVKNPEQFKAKIDARALGIIYHEQMNNAKNVSRFGILFSGIGDLLFGSVLKGHRAKVSMLINNPMRSYFYVESNRMAASRVRSRMDRRNAQTVIVTSVMENEGKSTVAANLALGIAEEGKKVLLIDADLRKPSQYKVFQLPEEMQVNLPEYLDDMKLSQEPARRYGDSTLYLIANNKRVRESRSSIRVDQLGMIVDYYQKEMDYIIIDTAPMALVTDTEYMSQIADGAIMVVREDVVLAEHINDAIDTLNRANCHVLGCIFNNATRKLTSMDYESANGNGGYYGRK